MEKEHGPRGVLGGYVWGFLKAEAAARGLLPGMTFETTLLGQVRTVDTGRQRIESFIPGWLQYEAIKNGFLIEAADFRRDDYSLRLLPSNAKLTWTRRGSGPTPS